MPKRNLRITIDIGFACSCDHDQAEWDEQAIFWEQHPEALAIAMMIHDKIHVSATETPPIEPRKEPECASNSNGPSQNQAPKASTESESDSSEANSSTFMDHFRTKPSPKQR